LKSHKIIITRDLLILVFFVVFNNSYSQDWVRIFTTTSGFGIETRDAIETYDKGYVLVSCYANYKYCLILKTDINGFEIWRKLIGNNYSFNVAESIEQTLDSGYIIAGSTSKYGDEDAFILKLNACFEKEWCKVLHTENEYDDYGRQVKQLPDGGYLLLTAYYEGLEQGKRIPPV
jgi:hypothetical protein